MKGKKEVKVVNATPEINLVPLKRDLHGELVEKEMTRYHRNRGYRS